MPKENLVTQRWSGLRQAASTIFTLTAVLPLLVLTWTLNRLHALHTIEAELGLGIALCVALLGFAMFRGLMGRLSNLILSLRMLVEKHEPAAAAAAKGVRVPVVGEIGEIGDVEQALAEKWRREATRCLQRPVLIYVVNSWTPIVGTLVDVTREGVLVKQADKQIAIGFRRFLGLKLAET
jgi:hypothetical protein